MTIVSVVTTWVPRHRPETMLMDADRLLVLSSYHAVRKTDGRVVVAQKMLDEALSFLAGWCGALRVVAEPIAAMPKHLETKVVVPASLPFELEVMSFRDRRFAKQIAESAVVLASANERQNHIAELCRLTGTPCVVDVEQSPAARRREATAAESNPLFRWAARLQANRQEAANRASISASAGVQCHGPAALRAYESLSGSPLLYFDARTTNDTRPGEDRLEERLSHVMCGEPLRLVFLGRLCSEQGADDLLPFASELRRMGVPYTLSVGGAGELQDSMRLAVSRYELCGEIHFRGSLDFKSQLIPLLQKEADLCICPDPYGDDVRTYVEALSCGVPIVGYANDTWAGLMALDGCGRSVPIGDFSLLAAAVARLHADREPLAKLSLKAWDFAGEHTAEATAARRMEHLRRCAGMESPLAEGIGYGD